MAVFVGLIMGKKKRSQKHVQLEPTTGELEKILGSLRSPEARAAFLWGVYEVDPKEKGGKAYAPPSVPKDYASIANQLSSKGKPGLAARLLKAVVPFVKLSENKESRRFDYFVAAANLFYKAGNYEGAAGALDLAADWLAEGTPNLKVVETARKCAEDIADYRNAHVFAATLGLTQQPLYARMLELHRKPADLDG